MCIIKVFLSSLLCTLLRVITFYSSHLFLIFLLLIMYKNIAHNQHTKKVKVSKLKEVVHPHVLVRIPCYDLSPVNASTMDPHITQGASGRCIFHALTGGEYKTQEHIHRDISDSRLLAIPTSCRRVAACNPD